MKKETYIIDYTVFFCSKPCESHTMRVKNCYSELQAKVRLEEYLKKKHFDMSYVIMQKCCVDFVSIFGSFRDFNPFGK